MFVDDEGILFNPFSVGPPESQGQRYDYKMPRSTTYPEPVYATWPPPKQHTNRSVSQDSLVRPGDVKAAKSQRGEVSISKAINEEMAAAKHFATEDGRINAGRQSRPDLSDKGRGGNSMTVIMPVRKGDAASRVSSVSVLAVEPSVAPSSKSRAKSKAGQHEDNESGSSHDRKRTESNITLTAKPNFNTSRQSNGADNASQGYHRSGAGGQHQDDRSVQSSFRAESDSFGSGRSRADNLSRVSTRSRASEHQADNISRASVRSKAADRDGDIISRVSVRRAKNYDDDNISRVSAKSRANADNISHVSVRSKAADRDADSISRASVRSKANDPNADNISRASVRSKANDPNADNISRASARSRTKEHNEDNISRISAISKAKVNNEDNISRASVKSKSKDHEEDNVSRVSGKSKATDRGGDNISVKSKGKDETDNPIHFDGSKASIKQVADYVKKELQMSMTTSKELGEKAALLSDRLRAGNEFKHNRFHSLVRMYTQNEPLKRFRDDRMSLWFKDAVLS
ncbi:transcription initiation factor TFIID subunit 1 isoform X2 [Drosophila mojavensis]|uniref:transcription initiation factor TFIID subunit 1 isoform X2 n=1 Tax=Drosophila mojavensis TaxID=7230 RepID=UPI0013EE93E1|nr:transcription initiation factor TFIID subunit 1 isoform X2 [Drosophila mojavensis]